MNPKINRFLVKLKLRKWTPDCMDGMLVWWTAKRGFVYNKKNLKNMKNNQQGFTLIETLLSVVLSAILILGVTITTVHIKEYQRRSFIERAVEQYCNDVVDYLWVEIKNSDYIDVGRRTRDIDKVTLYQRNIVTNKEISKIYTANSLGVYEGRQNNLLFLTNLEKLRQISWNTNYNLLYFKIQKVYDERDPYLDDFINSYYCISISIRVIVDGWATDISCNRNVEMVNFNLTTE